jgi:hypothetical protein
MPRLLKTYLCSAFKYHKAPFLVSRMLQQAAPAWLHLLMGVCRGYNRHRHACSVLITTMKVKDFEKETFFYSIFKGINNGFCLFPGLVATNTLENARTRINIEHSFDNLFRDWGNAVFHINEQERAGYYYLATRGF